MTTAVGTTSTDDLIEILAAAQRPQPRRPPWFVIAIAGLVGLGLAVAITCATLGIRSDFLASWTHPAIWLKLGVTGLILVCACLAARRLSLPGRGWKGARTVLTITFTVIMIWAAADLTTRPMAEWAHCIAGRDWSTCLMAIPLLSLAPMLAMGLAMRRLAPTRLEAAGTLLGLASGAVAAMAFSLYCRDDAVSFVAIWYGAALALSALIGRALGPRLLRW
ncbi:hypothetical protein RHAL1_P00081 (plasmid) [Beijerinckiaceae bacterium RH AL1]|nr:DUF1109 domain-containing protein [Beijerinckiaceae bacterium]VVB50294.1 hypothetical protein RHCH11_RHCH11_04178 [Beijerinckiaceae bacterium RH CH11]VVB50303.1 hypothetical protein RHAL8_04175 [Beijerinckiaceae bacterium RH AL8]VVC57335.1 hypothetical protein RHAL1_P00081 [Beijerinckiaceae bacterium RH AL1]